MTLDFPRNLRRALNLISTDVREPRYVRTIWLPTMRSRSRVSCVRLASRKAQEYFENDILLKTTCEGFGIFEDQDINPLAWPLLSKLHLHIFCFHRRLHLFPQNYNTMRFTSLLKLACTLALTTPSVFAADSEAWKTRSIYFVSFYSCIHISLILRKELIEADKKWDRFSLTDLPKRTLRTLLPVGT